jgi:CBS-domain-containing membrane protein
MTPSPVQTATPSTDVHELIQLMEQWQIRRVPVIDTRGRLLGVVAISDLALHVGPLEPLQIEELLARISSPSRALLDDGSVMPSTPNSVRSSRR